MLLYAMTTFYAVIEKNIQLFWFESELRLPP